MPASKKLIRVVLPVATATATTIATASLLSLKKIDPDSLLKEKEIDLANFTPADENFEEKVLLFAEEGKSDSVPQEDVNKAKEIIEDLKEDGNLGDQKDFKNKEEAMEFLENLPKQVLDALANDPKTNLLNLDSKALNNLGKFGEKIKSQQKSSGKSGQGASSQNSSTLGEGSQGSTSEKGRLDNLNNQNLGLPLDKEVGEKGQNIHGSPEGNGTFEGNLRDPSKVTDLQDNKIKGNKDSPSNFSEESALSGESLGADSQADTNEALGNSQDIHEPEGSLSSMTSIERGVSGENESELGPQGGQELRTPNGNNSSAEGALSGDDKEHLGQEEPAHKNLDGSSEVRDMQSVSDVPNHKDSPSSKPQLEKHKDKGPSSDDIGVSSSDSDQNHLRNDLDDLSHGSSSEKTPSLDSGSEANSFNRDTQKNNLRENSDRSSIESDHSSNDQSSPRGQGDSENFFFNENDLDFESLLDALGGNGKEVNIEELEHWSNKLDTTEKGLNNLIIRSN